MKITRTIKLKLNIGANDIIETVKEYTTAFNCVCNIGFNNKVFNSVELHNLTYSNIRSWSSLPSQLVVSARMKASEAIKSVLSKKSRVKLSKPESKQTAIRYDARSYNVWFDKNEVSLSSVNGRVKASFTMPEYFKQYVSWTRNSADLFIRNNTVFLNVVFSKDIEDKEISNNPYILGIDRGINKLAVCSDNKFYNDHIKKTVSRYRRLRKNLQSCGSQSAKRHLKRISQKENRFRRDVNHTITKRIIESVPKNSIIVIEDLKHIRERVKLSKDVRRNFHNWSFFQFEQFLTYKAQLKNIKIDFVDARYTSQKCSKCGYISKSNRQSQSNFKCKQCSNTLNADLNASRNIELNYRIAKRYSEGLSVNKPIVKQ